MKRLVTLVTLGVAVATAVPGATVLPAPVPLQALGQAPAQTPGQAPAQAPRPPARPDLRIVRIEVEPEPILDGATARLRVMLHNRSSAVAAGSIAVQVSHDRGTPQPLPNHQETLYMAADALAEVAFDVPRMALREAPYTFFAMVDVTDVVAEEDESNNTAWLRVAVCGDPQSTEQADGRDNDCDGLVDEEIGLPPDPADALRMLRELQARARWDAVPLLYALARPFAPSPVVYRVRLASEEGDFVGRPRPATARGGRGGRGGGDARGGQAGAGGRGSMTPAPQLGAALTADDPDSLLTLHDWNGGRLRSGDLIGLSDSVGEAVVAIGGGGGRVAVQSRHRLREALFTLVKIGALPGAAIVDGDAVALVASTGAFVTAEQGGGGPLRADRVAAAGWETFTITLEPEVSQ